MLFRSAFFAEKLKIFFGVLEIAVNAEAEISMSRVRRGVSLSRVRPVENIIFSVVRRDYVRKGKIAVTYFAVMRHFGKPRQHTVSYGGGNIRTFYFVGKLIGKLSQQAASFRLYFKLDIDEQSDVTVLFFGIFLCEPCKRFAADIFGNDSPFSVYRGHFKHARNVYSDLLSARLICRFAQNVCL